MPLLSSSKKSSSSPSTTSQPQGTRKRQWLPRWMKSYQVEKTRRQSVAALSRDDAEFLRAVEDEQDQEQRAPDGHGGGGEPTIYEGDSYDFDENRTRSVSSGGMGAGIAASTAVGSKLTPQSQISSVNISTTEWGKQLHEDEGFIEEVVEDAMKIETYRGKAERSVEHLIEKMTTALAQSESNDVTTKDLKFYVKIQSLLLALLASVNLYMHSTSSWHLIYERSFFSTVVVMIASFGCIAVAGGYMSDRKEVKNITRSVKTLMDNAQSTLKLLRVKVRAGGGDDTDSLPTSPSYDYDDKTYDINEHVLASDQWAEPGGETFMVRGKNYLADKKKIASAPSLFKLLAVDLIETPEGSLQNIAAHPKNRVARAKASGDNPNAFTFIFTFMIPGPPYLSYCAYWEVDKSLIEADTPFGSLAKRFFFGDSDAFRDDRFKFIPKIVEGNFAVKMAVKDTPTLMGHKLKQYYHRAEHYFEIDVDISSSNVARNITGLVIGYAKTLQIDMAITLQGEAEDELPEVVLGTCSAIHVDVLAAKELE